MYPFKSQSPSVSLATKQKHAHLSDRELLLHILERIDQMSQQLITLQSDVANNTSVTASAVVLLQGLKTELDAAIAANANGDDGAALAALSTSLEASTTSLAAAVATNTPASAPAPVAPAPAPAPTASAVSPPVATNTDGTPGTPVAGS